MTRQIRQVGIALMVMFSLLFLNVTYLQYLKADELSDHPGNTRRIVRDFSRPRGVIESADGAVLAESVPVDGQFSRLRRYPEAELFAHITGYFSFSVGSEGVERTYNADLAGRTQPLRQIRDLLEDRETTGDVVLTVDKRLQAVARDALGGRKGAVVALDPTTGAVRALWSFPSYDPNPLAQHDQKAVQDYWRALNQNADAPLLPRTFRQRYAPGSTFKVVTAAAALDRSPALATKDYPRLRELDLPRTEKNLPNFGGSSCGGPLTQLLKVSCNTGFAQLGLDLGAEALAGEARDFGFADKPPFDLPAVAASVFPEAGTFVNKEPFLAQSAIGQQDVSATPLQMALVAAGVANGGVVMKPHVMAEVRNASDEVVRAYQPEPWHQATSPETAASLRDMMVGVVNGGTAGRAAVPGVQVAAKTGTAQTIGDNAHAWLIAFAPADAPRIAIAVIVESQDGVSEATGGRVAAPIAQAVIRAALQG